MEKLEKLTEEFIFHCKYEKNLSLKTLKAYSIDLKQFKKFLDEYKHSTIITSIDRNILKGYIQHISCAKPKTIKRKIATIKALFNFLEFEDIITINPFRKMKIKIKEPRALPKVMTLDEVRRILISVYKCKREVEKVYKYSDLEQLQNIVVIELLFATGARVSELSNLKEENINIESGNIRLIGKGNKERIIQVCNSESKKILAEYYSIFKNKINQSNGYFFVNRLNKRLSEQSIRFIVRKYTKRAGINRKITPHTFRHSFATLLLEEQVDIKYIQQFLGHSSILTTQIYTHVNSEKQREILSLKHPRKQFSTCIEDISC